MRSTQVLESNTFGLGVGRWAAITVCALTLVLTVISPNPARAQIYTPIHSFTGGPGGQAPWAGVQIDHAGNLYGTTLGGGRGTCTSNLGTTGCGIAYEFTSGGLFSTLWQFTGGSDGAGPTTPLLVGPTLYVSTLGGGNTGDGCSNYLNVPGCGTIVSLLPPVSPPRSIQENHWIETILHPFQGSDGSGPSGNLARDGSGNLYGSTDAGGSVGYGVVFELTHGSWNESILYDFVGQDDGGNPDGGVALDPNGSGNVFGTARCCGLYGFGNVYELLANSGWEERLLYNFTSAGDGAYPWSGVNFDSSRNLYATTLYGPNFGPGGAAIELLNPNWSYQLVYNSFSGNCNDPGGPKLSTLLLDGAGNLYGTTYCQGRYGKGSVFKLTRSDDTWTETDLYDFIGGSDGAYPVGNLMFDSEGNLYGTTSAGGQFLDGVIFKITGL